MCLLFPLSSIVAGCVTWHVQIFAVGTSAVWLGMHGGTDSVGQSRNSVPAPSSPKVAPRAIAGAGAGVGVGAGAGAAAGGAVEASAIPIPPPEAVAAPLAGPTSNVADKPHACRLCSKAFSTHVNLTRHWNKDHPNVPMDDANAPNQAPNQAPIPAAQAQARSQGADVPQPAAAPAPAPAPSPAPVAASVEPASAAAAPVAPPPEDDPYATFGNVELLSLSFVSIDPATERRGGHREVVGSSELCGPAPELPARLGGFFLAAVHAMLELERLIKSTAMRYVDVSVSL